jgi:hypothetical protein
VSDSVFIYLFILSVNCCDISDDSTCIAFGLNDSTIRVYTLVPNKKLKLMKQFQDLELLEKESGNKILFFLFYNFYILIRLRRCFQSNA